MSHANPKRPRSLTPYSPSSLAADCVGAIFEYIELLAVPLLARVSVTWRAAAAARVADGADPATALGRAMRLDSVQLVPVDSAAAAVDGSNVACATIDMTDRKCSRRLFFNSSCCRVTVLGGFATSDCVLSGPRSCALALTPSPPLEPRKKKQEQLLQTAPEFGNEGGAAAAEPTPKAKKKPQHRHVKICGDSIIRGLTIEGNLIVSGGHLILLRCVIAQGSIVSALVRSRLTMIECDVQRSSIKPGKDTIVTIKRCTFTDDSGVRASQPASITVRESDFKGRAGMTYASSSIVISAAIDHLTIRDCSFTDVNYAVQLIRCLPPTQDIDGIHVMRTNHFNGQQEGGAFFVNASGGKLRVKNVQFSGSSREEGDKACSPPRDFFHALHGVTLAVDDTPANMAMPCTVVDGSVVAYYCTVDGSVVAATEESRILVRFGHCYDLLPGQQPHYVQVRFDQDAEFERYEILPKDFDLGKFATKQAKDFEELC